MHLYYKLYLFSLINKWIVEQKYLLRILKQKYWLCSQINLEEKLHWAADALKKTAVWKNKTFFFLLIFVKSLISQWSELMKLIKIKDKKSYLVHECVYFPAALIQNVSLTWYEHVKLKIIQTWSWCHVTLWIQHKLQNCCCWSLSPPAAQRRYCSPALRVWGPTASFRTQSLSPHKNKWCFCVRARLQK